MPTSTSAADIGLWYERYSPSLRSIAARVTRDPDDADDALHDTFVAAWLFRARFDDARNPLPWLATIAQRKALNIVSRRARGSRLAAAPRPRPRRKTKRCGSTRTPSSAGSCARNPRSR